MPFVDARCPNCGGEIKLDISKDQGFCMHCGSKVEVQEAVQRVKLEGQVTVDGIAGVDKLIQNGLTFMKLGDEAKAIDVFKNVTNEYPEDYRGWLELAKIYGRSFCDSYTFNVYAETESMLARAIKTCDDLNIKQMIEDLLHKYQDSYSLLNRKTELEKSIATFKSQLNKIDRILETEPDRLELEIKNNESDYESKIKACNDKINEIKFQRFSVIGFAFFVIFAPLICVVQTLVFLITGFFSPSHQSSYLKIKNTGWAFVLLIPLTIIANGIGYAFFYRNASRRLWLKTEFIDNFLHNPLEYFSKYPENFAGMAILLIGVLLLFVIFLKLKFKGHKRINELEKIRNDITQKFKEKESSIQHSNKSTLSKNIAEKSDTQKKLDDINSDLEEVSIAYSESQNNLTDSYECIMNKLVERGD